MRTWMQFALSNGTLLRALVGEGNPSVLLQPKLEELAKGYKRETDLKEVYENLTGRELVDLYCSQNLPIPTTKPLSPQQLEERIYVPAENAERLMKRLTGIQKAMQEGIQIDPMSQLSDDYLRELGVVFMSDNTTVSNPQNYIPIIRRKIQFWLSAEEVLHYNRWIPMVDEKREKGRTFSLHPHTIEASIEIVTDDSWAQTVDAAYPETVSVASGSLLHA